MTLDSDLFVKVALYGGMAMAIHGTFRMLRDAALLPKKLAEDEARRRATIAAQVNQSPPDDLSLQDMPASVTDQDRLLTELRLANSRKSAMTAFLLWLELGRFGAHAFYLGRKSEGMWRLGLSIAGWLITFAGLMLALTNDIRITHAPHWVAYALLGIGIPCYLLARILRAIDPFRLPGQIQADTGARRHRVQSETINGVKRF